MVKDRDRSPLPDHAQQPDRSPPRSPTATIVSVAILGFHRHPKPTSRDLVALAERVIDRIAACGWHHSDAILLPGGFLRLPDPVGHLSEPDRAMALLRRSVVRSLGELSLHLGSSCVLAVGIDLKPISKRIGGDQLVAAWRDGELISLVRKTFPANGDTDGSVPVYPVYETDFGSAARMITLASGRRAILLGCYDAFGLRGIVHRRFADLTAIRVVRNPTGDFERPTMEYRQSLLARWQRLMVVQPPDVALVAIHNFVRPGADGYWQRHGIAGASAALGGAPVIGASHFNLALPVNPHHSVLAARDVPQSHLNQGTWRLPHRWQPTASDVLTKTDGTPIALIRRFDI